MDEKWRQESSPEPIEPQESKGHVSFEPERTPFKPRYESISPPIRPLKRHATLSDHVEYIEPRKSSTYRKESANIPKYFGEDSRPRRQRSYGSQDDYRQRSEPRRRSTYTAQDDPYAPFRPRRRSTVRLESRHRSRSRPIISPEREYRSERNRSRRPSYDSYAEELLVDTDDSTDLDDESSAGTSGFSEEESDDESDTIDLVGDAAESAGLKSVLASLLSDEGKSPSNGHGPSLQVHLKSYEQRPGCTRYNVSVSQYTGEGLKEGEHSAKLTTTDNAKVELFQWIHIEPTSMRFDQFQTQVMEIGDLSHAEKHCIRSVFDRVPRIPDYSTRGNKTSSIEPIFVERAMATESFPAKTMYNRQRKVQFLCLPWMRISRSSARTDRNQAPMSTLLQTNLDDSPQAREQSQAACKVLNDPNVRVYVPQLWCLTIAQDMLITCGQIKREELTGSLVSVMKDVAGHQPSPYILVVFGSQTTWRLELIQCRTWFDLLSHFTDFWHYKIRIYCKGKEIKAMEWSLIYSTALRAGHLDLEIVFSKEISRSTRENDLYAKTMVQMRDKAGIPEEIKIMSSVVPQSTGQDTFHALSILTAKLAQLDSEPVDDAEALDQTMTYLDTHMRHSTPQAGRRVFKAIDATQYIKAREATHADAVKLLAGRTPHGSTHGDLQAPTDVVFKSLVTLLSPAEAIFRLFLPIDQDSTSARKYWGAILRILKTTVTEKEGEQAFGSKFKRGDLQSGFDIGIQLDNIIADIAILTDVLAILQPEDLVHLTMPKRLANAYTHLVLGVILFGTADERSLWHFQQLQADLETSRIELMQSCRRTNLISQTSLLPEDIALLLTARVMQDVSGEYPDSLSIYRRYTKQLDHLVNTDASQRSCQISLHLLKEELRALIALTTKQIDVLTSMIAKSEEAAESGLKTKISTSRAIAPHSYSQNNVAYSTVSHRVAGRNQYSKISRFYDGDDDNSSMDQIWPGHPGGLHEIFANQCLNYTIAKRVAFDSLSNKVNGLQELNEKRYNANRDKQDLALYAFAFVTVVFLPLSTVASIFGINTNDMRNLDQDQWLFWAVAAPLSVSVILGVLFWAGELGAFWRSFVGLFL